MEDRSGDDQSSISAIPTTAYEDCHVRSPSRSSLYPTKPVLSHSDDVETRLRSALQQFHATSTSVHPPTVNPIDLHRFSSVPRNSPSPRPTSPPSPDPMDDLTNFWLRSLSKTPLLTSRQKLCYGVVHTL